MARLPVPQRLTRHSRFRVEQLGNHKEMGDQERPFGVWRASPLLIVVVEF